MEGVWKRSLVNRLIKRNINNLEKNINVLQNNTDIEINEDTENKVMPYQHINRLKTFITSLLLLSTIQPT